MKRIITALLSLAMSVSSFAAITCQSLFPSQGLTDPHVWIKDGRIYLFAGHDVLDEFQNTWTIDSWQIWSSDDLRSWRYESTIDPKDTYIGDKPNCWAGDIVERDGKYYWYFSNRNIDTGVMVSDRIDRGYKDALGKPLLPADIIKGHPYDPEIFVEDGRYYILFSAGTYYISELNEDMISLKHKPRPIDVLDSEGKRVYTADKSTTFYRDGIYYLVWGEHYATADNIYGPYTYRGDFLRGGHSSVFKWGEQWYVVQVHKEVSLLYRGISLKPVEFDKNGFVVIPEDDCDYQYLRRTIEFCYGDMGMRTVSGEALKHNLKSETISGDLSADGTVVKSAEWLLNPTQNLSQVKITMKNHSNAAQARVEIESFNPQSTFWTKPEIKGEMWSQSFDLRPASEGFVTYTISLDASKLQRALRTLSIEPAVGKRSGRWEIKRIDIE
ncbi:MAG: family 43 glycosylhydrolase [Rikenellaceae bacterium]